MPWQPLFLTALRLAGCVAHAIGACKMGKSRVYEVRRNNPAFAGEWDEALEGYWDDLKAAAVTRALDGEKELVTHMGEVVFYFTLNGKVVHSSTPNADPHPLLKNRKSDALLAKLLEAEHPLFGVKARVTLSGDPVNPLIPAPAPGHPNFAGMTDAELDAFAASLRQGDCSPVASETGQPDGA